MSSESESDEIEIDGFPPESADATRFTSLKSSSEAGQHHKLYLPINSWSMDILSEDMIKNCVIALKEPTKMSEDERRRLIEQLECQLVNVQQSQTADPVWHAKVGSMFAKSPLYKPEVAKPPSVRVNIEIPSACPSLSNIKYNIDQPTYDSERMCWQTGMDFIFQNTNATIFESEHEAIAENKATQCDLGSSTQSDSFVLLPKPIAYDTRSRNAEKFIYPEIINLSTLDTRLSADSEFSFLEKFEETLQDFNPEDRLSHFKTSFRKYTDVIQKSLNKHIQDIRKLKTESEAVLNISYDKLTEAQFKRHSQNQLILIDVEQEISILGAEINRRDVNVEKMTRIQRNTDDSIELENEIKRTRFVNSLRLISQMILNLRTQVSTLTTELKDPQQQNTILNIKI